MVWLQTMKFLAKLLNKKPYTLNEVVSYIKDKKININQDLSTIMYDKEIITARKYTKYVLKFSFFTYV